MNKNNSLLLRAEEISSSLDINLKSFYEDNVSIRDQYKDLNHAKKVQYNELANIDSEGANNGFQMLVKDLDSLSSFVNDFYDGDIEVFKSDDLNIEMYEGTMKNIAYSFEHICKWHGIVNSQTDQ